MGMLLKKLLSTMFLVTFLVACKEEPPNPTPELLDPIYLDIQTQRDSKANFLEISKKSLKQTFEEWRTEPRVQQAVKKRKRGRYFKEQRDIRKLEQEVAYLDLALLSRKEKARRSYLKAFKAKKPWPDPNEYKVYKRLNELNSVSRRWDDRVPTLDDRVEKYEASRAPSSKKKK